MLSEPLNTYDNKKYNLNEFKKHYNIWDNYL